MKTKTKKTEAKKLSLNDLKKARGGSASRTKTVMLSNEERTNGGVSKDLP